MMSKEHIYLSLLQGISAGPGYTTDKISKEQAYEYLKADTEEDFGYDVEAWKRYFEQFDMSTPEGYRTAWKGKIKHLKKISEEYRKSKQKNDDGHTDSQ